MRFPGVASKEINQLATDLTENFDFRFLGPDASGHLKFRTANGQSYKLSSSPHKSFSVRIEKARALKLAGFEPTRRSRDTHAARQRSERHRHDAATHAARQESTWQQELQAAQRRAHRDRLCRQLDRRRSELVAIHHLMGAGRVRTF